MPNRDPDEARGRHLVRFRHDAYALIALLGIGSLLSIALFWMAPTVANWDLMTFYLPWYQLVGEAVRDGRVPGWNPRILSGMPLAGDPQSGWWYAPVMAAFAVLPALLALKLYLTWHVLAMGALAYILARLTGLSIAGGIAVAVAYAYMQNLGASTCCAIHMQFAPWIPLGMIGIELAARQTAWASRLLALSLSSIAIGQLAGAWVGQGLLLGAILIGGYLFWRTVFTTTSDTWLRRGVRFGVDAIWLFGLGLGLSAAGLLIRFDAVSRTFVGSDAYLGADAGVRGVGEAVWADALFDFKHYWFLHYLGGAAIAGVALGLLLCLKHRLFLFFGLVAVIGYVLPLQPTWLHELFFLIPMFESFYVHDPGRMMAVTPIGVAMLIGLTIEHRRALIGGRMRWASLAVICVTGLFVVQLEALDPEWQPAIITIIAASLFLAGLVLAGRNRRPLIVRVGIGLTLVALLIDPAGRAVMAGLNAGDREMWDTAVETSVGNRDDAGTAEALAELRRQYPEPWRYLGYLAPESVWWQGHEYYFEPWVLAAVANNRAMIVGEYDVQGYNPAQIVQYQHAMAAMNGFEREYHESLLYGEGFDSPILDLLNTRFIIVPKPIPVTTSGDGLIIDGRLTPGFQVIAETDAAVIIENQEHLPRAWLVYDVIELPADGALSAIGDGTIDPRVTASIETPPDAPLAPGAGTADVTGYQANEVEIVTTSDGPAFVVLADVHDPGWRVTIDGEPAELHRADGLLRGVYVPAGEHTVRFEYRPPELRLGLAISGVSLLTIIILASWTLTQSRQRNGQAV